MGKHMMIVHADGSETVAYQEALAFIAAEHDINHLHFHRDGNWQQYAITIKWDPERKDAIFGVGEINVPDALIPPEVREDAQIAVDEFVASIKRQEEYRMNAAAAPHFIADAVEDRPGWEAEGESAHRFVQDRLYFAMVTAMGARWHAMGYHSLHDKDAERLPGKDFDNLYDALEYCDSYLESRPLDWRLQ